MKKRAGTQLRSSRAAEGSGPTERVLHCRFCASCEVGVAFGTASCISDDLFGLKQTVKQERCKSE